MRPGNIREFHSCSMGDSGKKTPGKESKGAEEMTFEPCIIGKSKVWLPVDLIEDPTIFKSVISQETWDSVLTDDDRKRLTEFLPTFSEDDGKEKAETLRCLFEEENLKFGNPLTDFRERLRAGFMNPEIAEMEQALRKATFQDYKYAQQRRLHRLLKEVLISRQELLEAAMFTSPSAPVPIKRRLYRNDRAVDGVVNKKCKKMLAASKEEEYPRESSDEEESPPDMNGFHGSTHHDSGPDAVLGPKWTDYWPKEYDDLQQQEEAASNNNSDNCDPKPGTHSTFEPKPSHHEGKSQSPTKESSQIMLTQQQYIRLLEDYQDHVEDEHLKKHPELNTKSITLTGIISRAFPIPPPHHPPETGAAPNAEDIIVVKSGKKRKEKEKEKKRRKKKRVSTSPAVAIFAAPPQSTTPVSMGSLEGNSPYDLGHSPVDIMSTPESRPSTDNSLSPASCSPASAGSSSSDIKPPLRVHPSFFSLVRDIFSASPNHRLTLTKLRDSLARWQRSPVSMLSTWAVLQPSWAKVVDGAMMFLNGEIPVEPEVVPRVRYDDERQMWQWRSELPPDSEEELVTLFKQWLDTLPGMRAVPPKPQETSTSTPTSPSHSSVSQAAAIPVPEPILTFADQEKERYREPHRSYVYRTHGNQATVGPVKGVFGKDTTLNKAREHALLISDRPSYVTILSLVRDAVARLPNGEGTRSTVCEILKESHYLAESSDLQINNVVSGALDRLHYEKDPCIKYDSNRKLWVYLHRDRTKEEFERLHKEQAAEAKARKSVARQTKLLPKPGLRDSPSSGQPSRPGSALSDTSSENLSIEVCSPKGSPGRASPKPSRKSPAYSKSVSMPGIKGHSGDGLLANIVGAGSAGIRTDPLAVARSEASASGASKMLPGNILGQAPFIISPSKVGSLKSALRDLQQQSSGGMSAANSDNLIRQQLLAAKAGQMSRDTLGLLSQMQQMPSASLPSGIPEFGGGDMASRISAASGFNFQSNLTNTGPRMTKSLSVPCTLPDGKVVMLTPDIVVSSAKSRKRARSGSGGRKKAPAVSAAEGNTSANVTLSSSNPGTSLPASSAAVTAPQGSKPGRKSASASPSPLTVGPSKLATVSEALAMKRAEAALQSGRQQARAASTITLPPGALKGQTVKSILASVGIPLSGASVTVTRIDTQGMQGIGKQSTAKGKDTRKSPVFSGVNLLGSQATPKGRPSSSPSMSGKKSPMTSIHQTYGHQTIGLTTVTKDGQIVVQPVHLGLERPGSSSSPGMSRQSANAGGQAVTIKAIPVSLAKQQAEAAMSSKSSTGHQSNMQFVTTKHSVDEVGSHARKSRESKTGSTKQSRQHLTAATAAAALAQAGKMSTGADLKDFASVPLSVLFPGARQAGMAGTQKGGVPVLANHFLSGSQIPLASLTDGKGLIFQMPPGSNLMQLPVSGVSATPSRSAASTSSGNVPTTAASSAAGNRIDATGVRQQHAQMHFPSLGASPMKNVSTSKQQRTGTGSPALPPNIVTATIRSALAAAQSRSNLSGVPQRGTLTQQAGAQRPQHSMALSASAAMRLGAQSAANARGPPTQMRMPTSGAHQLPAGSQHHVQRSRAESKGSSLTASSIASIIANLKQNPMAAISLPTVPSAPLSQSASYAQSAAIARALSHHPQYSSAHTPPRSVGQSPKLTRVQSPNVTRVQASPSPSMSTASVLRSPNVSLGVGSSGMSKAPAATSASVSKTQNTAASRTPVTSLQRTQISTQSASIHSQHASQLPAYPLSPVTQIVGQSPTQRNVVTQSATRVTQPTATTAQSAATVAARQSPTTNHPVTLAGQQAQLLQQLQTTQANLLQQLQTTQASLIQQLQTTQSGLSQQSQAMQARHSQQSHSEARLSQQAQITHATTTTTPVSTTQSKVEPAPQRRVPPFEPRITRGKTKGKDNSGKKEPS